MKKLKYFNHFLLILIVVLIAGTVTYTCQEKKKQTVSETEVSQTTSTDTVYEDTVSIQDYLEFRQLTKESITIDSIFLNMPEIVLVNILMNYGTNLSNTEIVNIYLSNKEVYDNDIIGGAKAKQYIDSLNTITDTINTLMYCKP